MKTFTTSSLWSLIFLSGDLNLFQETCNFQSILTPLTSENIYFQPVYSCTDSLHLILDNVSSVHDDHDLTMIMNITNIRNPLATKRFLQHFISHETDANRNRKSAQSHRSVYTVFRGLIRKCRTIFLDREKRTYWGQFENSDRPAGSYTYMWKRVNSRYSVYADFFFRFSLNWFLKSSYLLENFEDNQMKSNKYKNIDV